MSVSVGHIQHNGSGLRGWVCRSRYTGRGICARRVTLLGRVGASGRALRVVFGASRYGELVGIGRSNSYSKVCPTTHLCWAASGSSVVSQRGNLWRPVWLGCLTLGLPILPLLSVSLGALEATGLSLDGLVWAGYAEAEFQLATASRGGARPTALSFLFLSEAGLGFFGGGVTLRDGVSECGGGFGGRAGLLEFAAGFGRLRLERTCLGSISSLSDLDDEARFESALFRYPCWGG